MESLLAADSFRVRFVEGKAEARGLSRHLERFRQTVAEAAPEFGNHIAGPKFEAFIETALRDIADYGQGFPRLELRTDGELGLQLRPLPELRESIELRSTSRRLIGDQESPNAIRPVAHPERKGPNIERYSMLNHEFEAEAILLDVAGNLLEGTTTSILWWHKNDLYVVRDQGRVASVTEALVTEAASRLGTTIRSASISPRELTHHEAWAVNALHGIRQITSIDGNRLPAPNSTRLRSSRTELDVAWEQIPS